MTWTPGSFTATPSVRITAIATWASAPSIPSMSTWKLFVRKPSSTADATPHEALLAMRKNAIYYAMIAPALLLSVSVVLVPAVMTVYVSFTDWNGISANMNWVGTENYATLFRDDVFRKALQNNILWMVMFLTIPVFVAFSTALILLNRKKTRDLYQTFYLFPYVLAAITNAMLWLNMIYSPIVGLIAWLKRQGLQVTSPLGQVDTALYGVAVVDMWRFWGFLAVIYLAALRQTPREQVESAQVEGANVIQLVRYVYLPNIMPVMRLMFAMIVITSFLTFDYIYLITAGGPAHATEMLSTIAYTLAFQVLKVGRASAVSVIISLFGLVAAIIYVRATVKETS